MFVTEGDCLVCSDCSVYNCKTGLGAHALKHLCLTGNHFMYTDVYALDFWGDFVGIVWLSSFVDFSAIHWKYDRCKHAEWAVTTTSASRLIYSMGNGG